MKTNSGIRSTRPLRGWRIALRFFALRSLSWLLLRQICSQPPPSPPGSPCDHRHRHQFGAAGARVGYASNSTGLSAATPTSVITEPSGRAMIVLGAPAIVVFEAVATIADSFG